MIDVLNWIAEHPGVSIGIGIFIVAAIHAARMNSGNQ